MDGAQVFFLNNLYSAGHLFLIFDPVGGRKDLLARVFSFKVFA